MKKFSPHELTELESGKGKCNPSYLIMGGEELAIQYTEAFLKEDRIFTKEGAMFLLALLLTLANPIMCWACLCPNEVMNKESEGFFSQVQVSNDMSSIIIERKNMQLSEKEALSKAAINYIAALSQIGEPNTDYLSENIAFLCAKNCKKVRNGKVLFEGKDFFAGQLDAGKEWLGSWSIAVKEILTSTDSRSAVIRYELTTEKEDDLMVIVILRFDSNYLISEINEVHNKSEK